MCEEEKVCHPGILVVDFFPYEIDFFREKAGCNYSSFGGNRKLSSDVLI
jgi:hypothetical protein